MRRGSSTASSAASGGTLRDVRAMSGADESLQRAEELLERLRTRVDALETSADSGGDIDEAVDSLAEIAELAKEIETEVQRARQAADARA